MKKLFILLFVILCAAPLAALHSGDEALEFPRMKWLRGNPVRVLDFDKTKSAQYKVVTFLLVHAPRVRNHLAMIESLNSYYKGKIEFCMVTSDPVSDAEGLLAGFNRGRVPFAVDEQREITRKYMAQSVLYPHSFVIDADGKILWSGEIADLGEVLERIDKGTFNAEAAKKIAPLMEQMQQLLSETDTRKLDRVTKEIFALEPGHPGAMRIRLFMLENSGRIREAADLLQSQRKAAPELVRLYFTEFDLCMRYAALQNRIPGLLSAFRQNVKAPMPRTIMVSNLLARRNNDPVLLREAVELFNTLPVPPRDQRGLYLSVKAELCCRLGLVDQAVSLQKEALSLNPGAPDLRRQLDYYHCVKSLQNKVR